MNSQPNSNSVHILGPGPDVARGRMATRSSAAWDGVASRAVDGEADGDHLPRQHHDPHGGTLEPGRGGRSRPAQSCSATQSYQLRIPSPVVADSVSIVRPGLTERAYSSQRATSKST